MEEERKKTEEELSRSEVRYRELLESINDVLFSMNIDGSIEYISPAIEKIAKTSSEVFLGEGYKRFIHP